MAVTTAGGLGVADRARVRTFRFPRLALGWTQLAAAILFLVGTAWDIQWHAAVGRDRLYTTPHLVMLAGIALTGLVSLAAVIVTTRRAHGGSEGVDATRFLGFFYAPLGAYLAGFGALASLVAFPLDDYWHTLYGVDVTLWAPFHVMIISGVILAALGATYTLMSGIHHAADRGDAYATTVGRVGGVVALASLLGLFDLFLGDTLKPIGLVAGPFGTMDLYPALVAVFGALVLAAAARCFRQVGAATATALVVLALRQIMFWFVPWATDLMVRVEGQSYRDSAPPFPVAPHLMPTSLVLAGVLVDLAVWLARRWQLPTTSAVLGVLAIAFVVVGFHDLPWLESLNGHFSMNLEFSVVLVSLPAAALLALVGGWFGLGVGASLAEVRR